MLTGGKRGVEVEMSAKERAGYLARQCRGRVAGQGNGWENNAKESLPFKGEVLERGENDSKGNVLFLMKAGGASKEVGAVEGASKEVGGAGEDSNKGQSDVLVCAPLHSAAKAVFEQINQQVLLLMLNIDGPKVMLIFRDRSFPPRWGCLASVATEARLKVVTQKLRTAFKEVSTRSMPQLTYC